MNQIFVFSGGVSSSVVGSTEPGDAVEEQRILNVLGGIFKAKGATVVQLKGKNYNILTKFIIHDIKFVCFIVSFQLFI